MVKIYNTPSHRAQLGARIGQTGSVTALIDTSDGFLGDLGHICEESGVGAELIKEKFPISEDLREAALRLGVNPHEFFLGDSDDYELIITCRPENVPRICSTVSQYGSVSVTEMGRITDRQGEIFVVSADGTRLLVKASGWDHFQKSEERK